MGLSDRHRMMREQKFSTSSAQIHVAVDHSEGPPIVLLHGVTRCGRDWLPLAPALREFGQLHILDHRGHGNSSRAANYRVADYVEDTVAYVASLRPPVTLIGHSLGAMVAAGTAAALGDRIRGVVLEDPTFEMTATRIHETAFPDNFRAYLKHCGSNQPTAQIARDLADALIRVPGLPEPVRFGTLRDAAALRFTAYCLKRLDPNVLPLIIEERWLEGYDVPRTLKSITCPVLFLQGDFAAGGALPDDYAAELVRDIKDCTHLKMIGVGHGIHGTQPIAMLNLVAPFLASLEP